MLGTVFLGHKWTVNLAKQINKQKNILVRKCNAKCIIDVKDFTVLNFYYPEAYKIYLWTEIKLKAQWAQGFCMQI